MIVTRGGSVTDMSDTNDYRQLVVPPGVWPDLVGWLAANGLRADPLPEEAQPGGNEPRIYLVAGTDALLRSRGMNIPE